MKCRYSQCKLGGEVDKEIAIKDGSAYYHKECYEKRKFKQDIQKYYLDNRKVFPKRDWNIALAKLIDGQQLDVGFVDYVARKAIKDIDSPYKIMYYCKFDKYKDEYNKKVKEELGRQQAKEMKNVKVEQEDFSFNYVDNKPIKRYNIY